jgi:hypothetical protein
MFLSRLHSNSIQKYVANLRGWQHDFIEASDKSALIIAGAAAEESWVAAARIQYWVGAE